MGRYSIGAKVRDLDGDICEIIGKPWKGAREVRYNGGKHDGMVLNWTKANLEPVISPEISEKAYSPSTQEQDKPWVPKVGDRVRVVKHCNWRGEPLRLSAAIGSEHEVTEMRHYFDDEGVATFVLSDGGGNFYTALNVEPVVAPATTWTPAVGDRVRFVESYFDVSVGDEGVIDGLCEDEMVRVAVSDTKYTVFSRRLELVAVAEATATALTIVAGGVYRSRRGEVWTDPQPLTGDDDGYTWRLLDEDGQSFRFFDDGSFFANMESSCDLAEVVSTPEPAAPPAKFKVGDRVVARVSFNGVKAGETRAITGIAGDMGAHLREENGEPCAFFTFDEIAPAAPTIPIGATIPIGTTVTFTASGRLSAINDNGHYQVTFPGLPSGRNSFALPADYVSAN